MALNKASSSLVLDLINTSNSLDLSFQNISFETPVLLADDEDGKNTSLVVAAIDKQGYVGNVTIKYNRVGFEELEAKDNTLLEIPVDGTMDDIVLALNSRYGLQLVIDNDIVEADLIDVIGYEPALISLDAVLGSYGFHGTLNLDIAWESIDLEDAIASNNLIGLKLQDIILSGYLVEYADLTGYGTNQTLIRSNLAFYDSGTNSVSYYGNIAGSSGALNFDLTEKTVNSFSVGSLPHFSNEYPPYTISVSGLEPRVIVVDNGGVSIITRDENNVFNQVSLIPDSVCPLLARYVESPSSNLYVAKCKGVVVGDMMYIVGMYAWTGRVTYLKEFYKYHIPTNTWTELGNITDQLDGKIYHAGNVFHHNGYIHYMGGVVVDGGTLTQNKKCHRYHIASDTWSTIADTPGYLLSDVICNAAVFEDNLYVIGGTDITTGSVPNNKIYRYNFKEDVWYDIGSVSGISKVGSAALVATNDGIVVMSLASDVYGTNMIKKAFMLV